MAYDAYFRTNAASLDGSNLAAWDQSADNATWGAASRLPGSLVGAKDSVNWTHGTSGAPFLMNYAMSEFVGDGTTVSYANCKITAAYVKLTSACVFKTRTLFGLGGANATLHCEDGSRIQFDTTGGSYDPGLSMQTAAGDTSSLLRISGHVIIEKVAGTRYASVTAGGFNQLGGHYQLDDGAWLELKNLGNASNAAFGYTMGQASRGVSGPNAKITMDGCGLFQGISSSVLHAQAVFDLGELRRTNSVAGVTMSYGAATRLASPGVRRLGTLVSDGVHVINMEDLTLPLVVVDNGKFNLASTNHPVFPLVATRKGSAYYTSNGDSFGPNTIDRHFIFFDSIGGFNPHGGRVTASGTTPVTYNHLLTQCNSEGANDGDFIQLNQPVVVRRAINPPGPRGQGCGKGYAVSPLASGASYHDVARVTHCVTDFVEASLVYMGEGNDTMRTDEAAALGCIVFAPYPSAGAAVIRSSATAQLTSDVVLPSKYDYNVHHNLRHGNGTTEHNGPYFNLNGNAAPIFSSAPNVHGLEDVNPKFTNYWGTLASWDLSLNAALGSPSTVSISYALTTLTFGVTNYANIHVGTIQFPGAIPADWTTGTALKCSGTGDAAFPTWVIAYGRDDTNHRLSFIYPHVTGDALPANVASCQIIGAGTDAAGWARIVADPSLCVSSFWPHVEDVYRPTNEALRGLYLGADAGAVDMAALGGAPAAPAIGLSAASVAFSATQGGSSPAAQTVTVSNTGSGSFAGLVAAKVGTIAWLTVSLSGSTLTLTAATGALAPGTYTGTVRITDANATNSPQDVAVSFTVASAVTALMASPFGAIGLAPTDTAQLDVTITVLNGLSTAVSYASSVAGVATVSGSGLVTAVAAGSTLVTVSSNTDPAKRVTLAVTVSATPLTLGGGGRRVVVVRR